MKLDLVKGGKENEEIDHWAFLEEIEAPMWVDLIEEAKLGHQNKDDEWFDTSHQFHQLSARKLRSAFSHTVEGNHKFEFNLLGISLSELPSSVSRSRGKDYKISSVLQDPNHPIKHLGTGSPRFDKGPDDECITKGKQTDEVNQLTSSDTVTISDSSLNGAVSASSEVSMSHRDKTGCSTVSTKGGSSTISVTTQSEPDKHLSQLSQPSGLVSSLRLNLRKSCATRQAMRVEMGNDGCSKDRKSSMRKSCVVLSSSSGVGERKMIPKGGNSQRDQTCGGLKQRKSSYGKLSVCSYPKPPHRDKSTSVEVKHNKCTTGEKDLKSCRSSLGKHMGPSSTIGSKVKSQVPVADQRKEGASSGTVLGKNIQVTARSTVLKPTKASNVHATNVASSSATRISSGKKPALSKVSESLKVNVKSSSSRASIVKKDGNNGLSRVVHPGKENVQSLVMSKGSNCTNKTVAEGQATKKRHAADNDKTRPLIAPKPKGKLNGNADVGRKTAPQRIYFR
ncbi:hypothetical protein Droror1_Dr00014199 [Drosera rotundifolia]